MDRVQSFLTLFVLGLSPEPTLTEKNLAHLLCLQKGLSASKIDQIKGSLVFKLRREFLQLNHPLALEGVGPVVLRHLDHFGETGGDQS